MGSFDTVHGGWRCGQTKALGKGYRGLLPGDAVELIPAPRNDQQLQAWAKGRDCGPAEQDFALEMAEDDYVVVRERQHLEWTAHLPTGLPLFDGLGELTEPTPQLNRSAASDEAGACPPVQVERLPGRPGHAGGAPHPAGLGAQPGRPVRRQQAFAVLKALYRGPLVDRDQVAVDGLVVAGGHR